MAWTDGSDKSSGDVITAAIWNSYLGSGDGIDEMETAKVTTAGDIVYATGDNALARLGIGSARQVLQMNSGATAPEWAASAQSTMTAKGDILAASAANTLARLAVGANDKVLTAASGESTGLKWGDAPGFTDPAEGESVSKQVQGMDSDSWSKASAVANRIYGAFLMPVWQDASITEVIYNEIDTGGNMIASVYSTTNTVMTRVATTGSVSVPTASGDLTKVSLSATLSAGTRYLLLTSFSATPDFSRTTPATTLTASVGSTFNYDPGSFTHASTINWSSVTKTDSDGIVFLLNNGGLIT